MARVLMPLATKDFDPTETGVPWDVFARAGVEVVFATEDGKPGACDPLMITGSLFGQLGATPENVAKYRAMEQTPAFRAPIRYAEIDPSRFDLLLLPGGHAKGMRQYLESKTLQEKVAAFFAAKKPVAAICHGGVVLARSVDPVTGRSVVAGRRMTALTKSLERTAYWISAWKLGDYYRTYPEYVQDEVVRALGDAKLFETGPFFASYGNPFTVRDGNLLTARWPGDASRFAAEALAMMNERASG
ncbi:MAG TPA: type 1 glutamine amidotransferase domain-containing protein [bacterium]|nr:type 1 glutamine amidotransferase domain-containing protein [bacterium]